MAALDEDEQLLRGYDVVEWIDDVAQYQCTRCRKVLINHYISNCQHKFCSNCKRILDDRSHRWRCPGCNEFIQDMDRQEFEFRDRVRNLRLYCPNRKYGCAHVCPFKDLKEHLKGCENTRESALPVLYTGEFPPEMLVEFRQLQSEMIEMHRKLIEMQRKMIEVEKKSHSREVDAEQKGVNESGWELSVEVNKMKKTMLKLRTNLFNINNRIDGVKSDLRVETARLRNDILELQKRGIKGEEKDDSLAREDLKAKISQLIGKTDAWLELMDFNNKKNNEQMQQLKLEFENEVRTLKLKFESEMKTLERTMNEKMSEQEVQRTMTNDRVSKLAHALGEEEGKRETVMSDVSNNASQIVDLKEKVESLGKELRVDLQNQQSKCRNDADKCLTEINSINVKAGVVGAEVEKCKAEVERVKIETDNSLREQKEKINKLVENESKILKLEMKADTWMEIVDFNNRKNNDQMNQLKNSVEQELKANLSRTEKEMKEMNMAGEKKWAVANQKLAQTLQEEGRKREEVRSIVKQNSSKIERLDKDLRVDLLNQSKCRSDVDTCLTEINNINVKAGVVRADLERCKAEVERVKMKTDNSLREQKEKLNKLVENESKILKLEMKEMNVAGEKKWVEANQKLAQALNEEGRKLGEVRSIVKQNSSQILEVNVKIERLDKDLRVDLLNQSKCRSDVDKCLVETNKLNVTANTLREEVDRRKAEIENVKTETIDKMAELIQKLDDEVFLQMKNNKTILDNGLKEIEVQCEKKMSNCRSDVQKCLIELHKVIINTLEDNVKPAMMRKMAIIERKIHVTKNEEICLGIALGESFTSFGLLHKSGKLEVIVNDYGNTTTPNYVSFSDNQIFIGKAAKREQPFNPKNTIYDMRRIIGLKFSEMEIRKEWPFQIIEKNEYPKILLDIPNGKKLYSPEKILSYVLKHVKDYASSYLGVKVKKAVIAVPMHFNITQSKATKFAGRLAGLDVIETINSPIAAAIAHRFRNYDIIKAKTTQNILVFKFGGNRLEVCILAITDGNYKVVATSEDRNCGGRDFDNNVVEHFVQELMKKKIDISNNDKARTRLRQECEKGKIHLNRSAETTIVVDNLLFNFHFTDILSRTKFDQLNQKLYAKIKVIINSTLIQAKLKIESINDVLLVGGSTRLLAVQKMMQEMFPNKIRQNFNNEEITAYGAAVYGAYLNGDKHAVFENALKKITIL